MSIDKIFVSLLGFILMGLIYWFFFGKKDEAVTAKGKIEILVEGGYKPDIINLEKGVKTTLLIKRTDSNPCLEEFVLPGFSIKKYLPINKTVEVKIKPDKAGVFGFHCGMSMYHGKLNVV